MRRHDRDERRRGRAGFSLVELLVVVAIIGLIISLILVAAADGVRRAEERATQSLITKISTGLEDRIDALLNSQAPVNQTHRYLAAINYNSSGSNYIPVGATTGSGSDERRAQVIAQFDYIRAELPDVFFLNNNTSDGTAFHNTYPLNFAAAPYPLPTGGTTYQNFYLPLGNLSVGLPLDLNNNLVPNTINTPNVISTPYTPPPVSGIFGASFSAIGGITKNLGYTPAGYDGIDNNGDNQIDEMAEGVPSGMSTTAFATQVDAQLAKHTHKTARAEMLYAVLVEGVGPLGSVFNRDDFTAREVQDTDGDGLPEFVDAWGEPLQFFRWPIYFGGDSVPGSSDSQKGVDSYGNYSEIRQLDPLDPNQLLVSPGWWSSAGNPAFTSSSSFSPTFSTPSGNAANGESQGALAFMNFFHSLVDPFPGTSGTGWDRTGNYSRRAYFSKFLVLSAGPDKEPGVAQFAKDYQDLCGGARFPFPDPNKTMERNALSLIFVENQAAQSEPNIDSSISSFVRTGSFYEVPNLSSPTTIFLQTNVGLDDISNHNIQATGTGVR